MKKKVLLTLMIIIAVISILIVKNQSNSTQNEEKKLLESFKKGYENLIFNERITMSNQLDTKVISRLAEILDKTNLTELEYEDEGCRISLVRNLGGAVSNVSYAPAPVANVSVAPQVQTEPSVVSEAPSGEVDYTNSPNAVKSPMVGVVYLSADPKSPNYVKVGDSEFVEKGEILKSMKIKTKPLQTTAQKHPSKQQIKQ